MKKQEGKKCSIFFVLLKIQGKNTTKLCTLTGKSKESRTGKKRLNYSHNLKRWRNNMKVLGISFGRKNQRSDVMVKEALFAAKAAGADVQFINTVTMNIGPCIACD